MKFLLVFIFCGVLVQGEFIKNSTYELIPQADGTFQLMNVIEIEKSGFVLSDRKQLQVIFSLFTRRNPKSGQTIPLNDAATLLRSNFNNRNPTRIITHGWQNDGNSAINQLVRDAYLGRGDYNVFVVDWGSVAHSDNYISVKSHVDDVGRRVAQFIDFLSLNGGMRFDTLYLIGHSLGAHASGLAGKYVKRGRINTIFGLDPAHPLFFLNSPDKRLASTDAIYVETIHTNGKKLGFYDPIGTASFYPNWGKNQPNCGKDLTGTCSHSRSYQLFAKTIQGQNYNVIGCNNFDEIKSQKCSKRTNIRMGGDPSNNGRARGVFYVSY